MKKIIPALFAFLLLSWGLIAQNLSVEPAENNIDTLLDFANGMGFDIVIHANMVNNSEEAIDVRWVRIVEDIPDGWGSAVCDNTQCWSPQVNSNVNPDSAPNVPIMLAPGEEGILDVHVYPAERPGIATLTVELYDNADFDNIVSSGTFVFNVEDESVNVSELEKAAIKVFPNPTTDYFELENADFVNEIVVHNIIGRQVKSFFAYPNKKYDLTDLPNGMYLMSLINYEEGIIKTMRLSKRSFNP